MPYVGKTPVVGNFVKLDAIVTSATATYNLLNGGVAYFPQTANNCIVSLNGVIQSPTSAYTISGSTIVFDSALTSADSIDFILVLGDVLSIGTPSDATVGFAKVTSNLITGATAETSIAGGDSVLIYDDSASALRKMTRTNFVAGIGGTNTPAFAAHANTNQTITDVTATKVTLGTELLDTDNAFTSSEFTVPTGKGGEYFLYGNIYFYGGSSANINALELFIRKNGTNVAYGISNTGANDATDDGISIEAIVNCSAGDVLTLNIYADTTSGNGFIVNQTGANRFGGFRLIQ
jgi:hypothetical protein